MHELLQDFPVVVEIPVRWGDMDAFQHVNNTVYFRFFETCRIEYYQQVGLNDIFVTAKISSILAATSCRFKAPVTYPDTLLVGGRMKFLNADRFLQEYAVVSQKTQRVVATGDALNVAYNYTALAKTDFPDSIQKAITTLEGREVPHFPAESFK